MPIKAHAFQIFELCGGVPNLGLAILFDSPGIEGFAVSDLDSGKLIFLHTALADAELPHARP